MESHLVALLVGLFFLAIHSNPVRGEPDGAASFTSFVVFGDSYTDQGVYQYRPGSDGTVPSPKNITSTGGRIWPEYVKQYSGVNVYDYAVSGAVCDIVFSDTARKAVKQDQIPSFLADNSYINNATGLPALENPTSSTVYAIWIGTNDIGSTGFLTERQPIGMPLTNYTDCVFDQLDSLYAVGARRFVLFNLAPLDLTPQYALPENGGVDVSPYWTDKLDYSTNLTQISEKMRQYIILANAVYEYEVPYQVKFAKRYPQSSFTLYDVHSLLTDIWNNPSLYLNGTLPLNVTGYITECAATTCASLADRDSYLWHDPLHPSEQTDRIIAQELVKVIDGQSKWATYWNDE